MRLRALVFLCLMTSSVAARAGEAHPGAGSPAALPPHPRLIATADDFDRIRESIAKPGPARDAFEFLRETAEREFAEPPVERIPIGRRLPASADILRRLVNFSLLYRVTGETRWAERAEREMLAVAAFPDWNPTTFLNTAEIAAAMGIAYDWLYDALPPDSRRVIREALVKQALGPGDTGKNRWRTFHNNWVQVCESGLTIAALAIAEDEPELAARTLARARRNVPPLLDSYAPAGAYVEGTSYWAYGTTYHLLLIEALRTATGSADNLTSPAFLKSADAINILTGPGGGFFNYGDSHEHRVFMPALYWFARETGRPAIVADEHTRMREPTKANHLRKDGDKASLPNRFLAFALLWMSPNPAAEPVPPPSSWSTQGANPLAVFRRGEGPGSLFAAIKGGRARGSHGHMDAGSFVLELGGVRWTTDLGAPVYNEVERHGVQLFGKDRWTVYALGPHSHSVPLIDDALPDEHATATLLRFSESPQSAVIDLTPLHGPLAKRLHRELRVGSDDAILIRDEIDGVAPGSRYRFSWMTRASVETDAVGATLRQDGKTLRLDVAADAPFEVVNEDASHPRAAYDAPQPGLRRISVLFTVQKPAHFIEVLATLEKHAGR